MPTSFARSVDWALDSISLDAGLDLVVWYEPFDDGCGPRDHETEDTRYRIRFSRPAAWAFVDLSLMWQYFPETDCPPVIQEVDRDEDHVYIREFSINQESHGGEQWRRFRLTIGSDVIEVISVDGPRIETA